MSEHPPQRPPPTRWASSRHPFIYEINTWPWLSELAATDGDPVDLSTVAAQEWDAIADAGFDAVWLMGVWQRSPAGAAVAVANGGLVAEFVAVLPDWTPQDVVGSAYCIRNYEVDEHLGGREGLAVARSALAARGLALILDFVPNHVAPDHPWTVAHPEYFVHGTAAERDADPASFIAVDGYVLANGRDPYFPAWPDVVQLDAFAPGLRDELVDTLHDIAAQCDGVRCDMAMLVMNDVFAKTWGERVARPPGGEFWPTAISSVRRTHPDFTFIAEAYWDREWALQEQGFDFCYDKRLYDRLLAGDAAAVRDHLRADPAFQNRLLRFVENHDEPRAAAIGDAARREAVTLAALTQTGARLVHHGQLEGRLTRLPVFLGRSPREDTDPDWAAFHRALLEALRDSTFRTGEWMLCDTANLLAWCWNGDRRWLVVVNLGTADASDHVRVPWNDVTVGDHRLVDPIADVEWVRSGRELRDGLYVELAPWRYHLFEVVPPGGQSSAESR
ncbi:alpha-amylase family glycosyl hydrolase [Mycolicibacterium sp.]|uniref:alpha-amylase family glycosyl hydrolase n=1 Tax=Mycolicibacterium sp. TaxID=2320850 RepID=UPI001A28862C|nr:alpha-amylase family glycosyl hydrolase [Mycolicibacterium sp.]MBJ7337056.1 alpha-amylase [Mycolicibacterium sp.]